MIANAFDRLIVSFAFLVAPATFAAAADDPPGKADLLGKATARFAVLDDGRVHYKSFGDGSTAVVFIHGWTCDLSFWRAQVKDFAGKTRLVFVDLPGHGRSHKPKVAYTMDYFARALEAVLKDAGVETAVLVGHSMGTPVMRQYYRRNPKGTRALVAVDGSLKPDDMTPAEIGKYVAQFTGPEYKENLSKAVDTMFWKKTPNEVRATIKGAMLSTPQHVVVSALKGMFDAAIWKEDPIKVPLLVVSAKASDWPAGYEMYVRKLAPKTEYHVLDEVGHFLMLEKPEVFNELLAGFLRKQGVLKP